MVSSLARMLSSFVSRLLDLGELAVAVLLLIIEKLLRFIAMPFFGLVSEELLTKYFSLSPGWLRRSGDAVDDCDRSVVELLKAKVSAQGYPAEQHYVRTPDGYILGMQRIPCGRQQRSAAAAGAGKQKPVVFMMHGFMQCSEALVVRARPEDSLPMALADAGYDVWLGNVRGCKYSFKHESLKPSDAKFWDFSLDEQIRYDLPVMIEYVLGHTNAPSISYIGFSQGTALAFGALSQAPQFASRINLFIALASTALVQGLHNPLIDSIARARPDLVFLMFGRKSFLPVTLFWRRMLGRRAFAWLMDACNRALFGWQSNEMAEDEKPLLHSHLYSYASVKAVVHWFQIIRTRMFDDTLQAKPAGMYSGHEVPVYPLGRIPTPLALFYGGKDNLSDMDELLKILPKPILIHREPDYEHLDFLWAKTTRERLHPPILKLLAEYNPLPPQP